MTKGAFCCSWITYSYTSKHCLVCGSEGGAAIQHRGTISCHMGIQEVSVKKRNEEVIPIS